MAVHCHSYLSASGSPPSTSQRSLRARSPQKLTTSRPVAHHSTDLGSSEAPIIIQALKVYKISFKTSVNMSVTNDYKN